MGERAVQGQVKEAYMTARDSGVKLSTGLHKLFECALQIGKRHGAEPLRPPSDTLTQRKSHHRVLCR